MFYVALTKQTLSRCIASIEECCILVNQNVGNMYDDVQ